MAQSHSRGIETLPGVGHLQRMPSPLASPSAETSRWPVFVPLVVAAALSLIAFFWMPWERIHPNDASLREAIGYGPYWSERFSHVPGAHVDWKAFLINVAVIWVVCCVGAIMLNASNQRN